MEDQGWQLRGAAFVPMMDAADLGQLDDRTEVWGLDGAWDRRVVGKALMCAGAVVVGEV